MKDYLNVIRNHYADFGGRARRREFWMFTLINTVIVFLLYLPLIPLAAQFSAAAAGGDAVAAPAGPSGLALIALLLLSVYSLAVFVPTLAVAVRRLHDTGKSGWWYLLNFVPVANIALLVFYVLDSQPGANKWGPNPKGAGGTGGGEVAW